MLRIEASPDDLARSAFGVSPLFELTSLLHALDDTHGRRRPVWPAGLESAYLRARRDADLELVRALQGATFGADFLARPPDGPDQTWADELSALRATPPDRLRTEIARSLQLAPPASARVAAVLRGPDALRHLCGALDTCWRFLLAPHWPQLAEVCRADLAFRHEQLAGHGWVDTVRGLHPALRYRDNRIEIPSARGEARISRPDLRLVFVPSVFVRPGLSLQATDGRWAALYYPARPHAVEIRGVTRPKNAVLADLLGRTRAGLLLALDGQGRTTTDLAHNLGLSPSCISDHLGVLRRSRLVTGSRRGRSVVYRQTPLGAALARGAEISVEGAEVPTDQAPAAGTGS